MGDVSVSPEKNPQKEPSPVWKERENLTEEEVKGLQGLVNLETLVVQRAKATDYNFDLAMMATDLYEAAFLPFGQSSRSYRNTNIMVQGGNLEYPDFNEVPRLMRELGREVQAQRAQIESPSDLGAILKLCGKIHEMVYIHPFPDGNGRVTRGLIHFVLKRFGYRLPEWRFKGRDAYLDVVEEARENPAVFEEFLTNAIIASYRREELTSGLAEIVDVREALESLLTELQPKREAIAV